MFSMVVDGLSGWWDLLVIHPDPFFLLVRTLETTCRDIPVISDPLRSSQETIQNYSGTSIWRPRMIGQVCVVSLLRRRVPGLPPSL